MATKDKILFMNRMWLLECVKQLHVIIHFVLFTVWIHFAINMKCRKTIVLRSSIDFRWIYQWIILVFWTKPWIVRSLIISFGGTFWVFWGFGRIAELPVEIKQSFLKKSKAAWTKLRMYLIMSPFHNQFSFFFTVDLVSVLLLRTPTKSQDNQINLKLSLPVHYLFSVLCLRDFILMLLPLDRHEIDSCSSE